VSQEMLAGEPVLPPSYRLPTGLPPEVRTAGPGATDRGRLASSVGPARVTVPQPVMMAALHFSQIRFDKHPCRRTVRVGSVTVMAPFGAGESRCAYHLPELFSTSLKPDGRPRWSQAGTRLTAASSARCLISCIRRLPELTRATSKFVLLAWMSLIVSYVRVRSRSGYGRFKSPWSGSVLHSGSIYADAKLMGVQEQGVCSHDRAAQL
jgi:hypothetical protein